MSHETHPPLISHPHRARRRRALAARAHLFPSRRRQRRHPRRRRRLQRPRPGPHQRLPRHERRAHRRAVRRGQRGARQGRRAARGRRTSRSRPYKDIRKLLESKEVDAISIATPNHWHSLGAIWALPGGQGRVCRKARLAQRVGRPAAREGRGQIQAHRADGRAEPLGHGPRRRRSSG